MIEDRKIRIAICRGNFYNFFHFYFAHYIKHETSSFQKEMFYIAENEEVKNFFVVAFRGSGKSTILTMGYPLWAILGKQQKKFVLILCQTQNQSKMHMASLRRELEENELLKNDLGPFKEESPEWGIFSVVFSKIGARITVASSEQSIRGSRHNQHRPDLIVCDDVESIVSVRTKEGRQKIHQWLTGEIIPAGDINTRLVIAGNLLHQDSLLMRIKEDLANKKIDGIFREYPLFDEKGAVAWPGKYPKKEDIEKERRRVGDEIAWQREYLLNIVPGYEKIIHPEWIKKYGKLPSFNSPDYQGTYIGVDPAISEKENASKTAMVVASFFGEKDDRKIYIHPNPINKRMTFYEMEKTVEFLCNSIEDKKGGIPIIEDVGSQKWLHDQLKRKDISAELSKTRGLSKDIRLKRAGIQVEAGRVFFPEKGAEELLDQILNFGTEKYDDLADAFSIVVSGGVEKEKEKPGFLKFLEEKVKQTEERTPKSPDSEDYLRGWLRGQGYFGPLGGIK